MWDMAKKRAAFRKHLTVYIVINAFLWALWYLTGGRTYGNDGVPWPVWPALGWGIGLAFQFFGAYVNHDDKDTEREYHKLQNKNRQ